VKGYRKFAIVLIALVFAFVLALTGKLTTDFATIAVAAVGAFAAANAYEHKVESAPEAPVP
jgi:hypothetical protein